MHPVIQAYVAAHKTIPYPQLVAKELGMTLDEAILVVKGALTEMATQDATKGMQLFCRFFENHTDLFRQFRELNASEKLTKTPAFHEVGEQVQNKLWHLEQILTDKMFKRDTDKTVTAFYDHVRLFFPRYDLIGTE